MNEMTREILFRGKSDFDHIYPYELEIIGNIHDNPELLKEGAE